MVKRKVAALEKVEADLVNLQYKIRRDPKSYAQEFYDQWLAYDAQRQIFISSPTTASSEDVTKFHDLVDLVAHVADLYPDITGPYAGHLKDLLNQHHAVLNPELREKVVGSLVLIRRKDVIDSANLLTTLFPILVSTPSKSLRSLLYSKIISELRESNSKTTNHRLNRTIQTVLHNLVTSDRTSAKGQWATRITRELWRRQVWTDAKPCDVMKEACLSDNEKVVVGGVRFFLGGDKEREDADDSSDEEIDLRRVKHIGGINKKSKKRAKVYERAVDKVKRQDKKKHAPHPLNFSALHLLHDPQGFAEQLFQKHLQNTKNRFSLDNKLLILQLVTRLVGLHQLTVISLYSWFARYLTPKQAQVTSFLASLAQATHSLVPPDALEPLVIKIANEFVSEGSASEVAAAGINAIREICVRQPLCITETLLQDLVLYQRSKDKGVVMAAKGLQSLYREQYPELLQKKYRGKEATMGLRSGAVRQRKFGEQDVGGIEGIELLEQYKEALKKKRFEEAMANGDDPNKEGEDDDGFHSDDWELGSSESDDDSDGWINVSDDEDEAVAKPPAPKRQKKGGDDAAPDLVNAEKEKAATEAAAEATRISVLATTSILTPADLVKLQELRREANVDKALGIRSKRVQDMIDRHVDEGVTADDIELPAQLGKKTTREERVAMAKEGKPGRDEHKSTQAIRKSKKEAEGKSTTNKEKARKKNFMMTVGKARQKNKRSLTDTKNLLKMHISRSKKGGRRGNFA